MYGQCYLCFRKYKAWGVKGVKEEVANNVSRLGSCHLKTRAKPLVTGAVHDGVYLHIGQAVPSLAWLNTDGTAKVMMPATPICPGISTHRLGTVCSPTLATPVGPGHSKKQQSCLVRFMLKYCT